LHTPLYRDPLRHRIVLFVSSKEAELCTVSGNASSNFLQLPNLNPYLLSAAEAFCPATAEPEIMLRFLTFVNYSSANFLRRLSDRDWHLAGFLLHSCGFSAAL
jgi:hypothetical protein